MNEKEINFKPSVEQLKTDMKKEAFVGFLYILFFAIALVLMKQYIIPLFFPLFLLVLFYRYFKFKSNIEDRFIRIENNQVIQETPDLPRGMRLINLEVYKRAKFKSNKIFLIENQGISIGMCIDLKGYPEKSLIFATIENRIKNHNEENPKPACSRPRFKGVSRVLPMNEKEKNEVQDIIKKSPRRIWGYWMFIFPIILILIGILIHIFLLKYFESKNGQSIEIMLKSGKKISTWLENRDVKKVILTISLAIIISFGMLAQLAYTSFKQKKLIKRMAKELKIID